MLKGFCQSVHWAQQNYTVILWDCPFKGIWYLMKKSQMNLIHKKQFVFKLTSHGKRKGRNWHGIKLWKNLTLEEEIINFAFSIFLNRMTSSEYYVQKCFLHIFLFLLHIRSLIIFDENPKTLKFSLLTFTSTVSYWKLYFLNSSWTQVLNIFSIFPCLTQAVPQRTGPGILQTPGLAGACWLWSHLKIKFLLRVHPVLYFFSLTSKKII